MSVGLLECEAANVPASVFNPVGLVDVSAKLQTPLAYIADRLYDQLDEMVSQAASAPTAKDFKSLRNDLFPSFIKLSLAVSNVMLAKVDRSELPSIIHASFASLEARFASEAPSYFGDEAYQEIMFSVSTLKSAYRWLPHVASTEVAEGARQQDMELARNVNNASLWANFHLFALRSALHKNLIVIPEVLQELLTGLRMSVMVYAYVRQALDLRNTLTARYEEKLTVPWDNEDEALAKAD